MVRITSRHPLPAAAPFGKAFPVAVLVLLWRHGNIRGFKVWSCQLADPNTEQFRPRCHYGYRYFFVWPVFHIRSHLVTIWLLFGCNPNRNQSPLRLFQTPAFRQDLYRFGTKQHCALHLFLGLALSVSLPLCPSVSLAFCQGLAVVSSPM